MSNTPGDRIISTFADDPEMGELVDLFVLELPERIAKLESAMRAADTEQIRRIAHQLKGAGSGYGFDAISVAGASLEHAIAEGRPIEEIRERFALLHNVCERVGRAA